MWIDLSFFVVFFVLKEKETLFSTFTVSCSPCCSQQRSEIKALFQEENRELWGKKDAGGGWKVSQSRRSVCAVTHQWLRPSSPHPPTHPPSAAQYPSTHAHMHLNTCSRLHISASGFFFFFTRFTTYSICIARAFSGFLKCLSCGCVCLHEEEDRKDGWASFTHDHHLFRFSRLTKSKMVNAPQSSWNRLSYESFWKALTFLGPRTRWH